MWNSVISFLLYMEEATPSIESVVTGTTGGMEYNCTSTCR